MSADRVASAILTCIVSALCICISKFMDVDPSMIYGSIILYFMIWDRM